MLPTTLIAAAATLGKDIGLGLELVIVLGPIVVNAIRNTWLTATKLGKGSWITIPLKGDNAWKIDSKSIN